MSKPEGNTSDAFLMTFMSLFYLSIPIIYIYMMLLSPKVGLIINLIIILIILLRLFIGPADISVMFNVPALIFFFIVHIILYANK